MIKIYWLMGLISKRSCYRSDGRPKQKYPTKEAAERAAIAIEAKHGSKLDAYRCWFRCRKWHIGSSVTTQVR
jgi:hypothetical protein